LSLLPLAAAGVGCEGSAKRTGIHSRDLYGRHLRKARIVMRILPLLLVAAFAAAVVYWLTRSRTAALAIGVVVLGAMLFIGITT
jgi:hypothetical protein